MDQENLPKVESEPKLEWPEGLEINVWREDGDGSVCALLAEGHWDTTLFEKLLASEGVVGSATQSYKYPYPDQDPEDDMKLWETCSKDGDGHLPITHMEIDTITKPMDEEDLDEIIAQCSWN